MDTYTTAHAHIQPCTRTPPHTHTYKHVHVHHRTRTLTSMLTIFLVTHPLLPLASNQLSSLDHGYFLYPSLQCCERLKTYSWLDFYHPASVSHWICTFVVIACVIPVRAHEACIMYLILPVIIIRLVVCEPRSCCVDDAVGTSCTT
jgi:hypothetical protein